MRFRTSWLARLLRGRRLDRNPLRRGSDRAETIVIGALLAAFLAAAPFAAHAAGAWGHDSAARQAQAQRASLVQVTATLLWSAPILAGYGSGSGFAAEARWRAPDGPVRTGELFVTPGAAASHSTRIWVDQTGRADQSAAERGPDDRPGSTGRGGGSRQPRGCAGHGGLAGPQVPRPPPVVRVGHGVAGERATVEPAALGPAVW